MDTKLTLKLDKDIIEQVKIYAQNTQQSLSALVERYFRYLLNQEQEHPRAPNKVSPTVKELSGIIRLEQDDNVQEDYTTYLLEKYQA